MFAKDAQQLLRGACPIVGSYGSADVFIRRSADRLERALTVNGIPHDVKVYPGVGHGFLNDHHDRMYQMMKVAGIGTTSQPPRMRAGASWRSSTLI